MRTWVQVVSLGQGEGSRGARERDREEHIQWYPTGNPGGGECVPSLLLWAIGGCVLQQELWEAWNVLELS